jgi:hypothetical protein
MMQGVTLLVMTIINLTFKLAQIIVHGLFNLIKWAISKTQ